ncbi:uncharacterized protein H6S33_012035 [Morchella sextelata]|uniref:uncharacterized protein n=1 Tax=Morchella sextelata TaxID=1174677 RepID=UPI001D04E32F|nr:uncharacterized protein H6S33_012035 [Morchella sextelata]KAH0610508.1 hypothetical protein H6S33_012035 [Morchella sextelata]
MPDINRLQPVPESTDDTKRPPGDGPDPDPMMPDTNRLQPVPESTDDTKRPPGDGPDPDPTMPDTKRWKWDDRERYESKLKSIEAGCNQYEQKLMGGIVNTTNISPNYSDIHINRTVIDQLERVTALALNRPDAFQYGVLRRNKVTGALLYGPPGTGKTLLARGLAKQSGFLMLEVTGADIFQKCWGEPEKYIKAAFTLARKLSPCILFIDEADGIFGARKSGDRKHQRGMLNQFLLEWDGMGSSMDSPFLLLSTNRPFDLDPAVLRRAPVHIHIDIPTVHQRQGILQLLLKHEDLGPDINLPILARLTPSYTGSDLKNLCVTAALACVETEVPDPVTGEYPSRRTLQRRHFNFALKSVRATTLNPKQLSQLDAFHRRAGG